MNTRSRITPGDVSRVGAGRRLGLAERLLIADCLRAGHSHRRIAQIVCRSQSTISREIARNSVDGIYDAYHASYSLVICGVWSGVMVACGHTFLYLTRTAR
ncbi:helix-turn-helix domain-containing protein [Corynebacterium amycolatum]|uniref:helix-turn-helix domain-containing protein n=1 Tax=Corynebacterium amycolatum TaxID=43765 RepID=UPI003757D8FE